MPRICSLHLFLFFALNSASFSPQLKNLSHTITDPLSPHSPSMNSLNKAHLGPLWPASSLKAAHPSARVVVYACHAPNQLLGTLLSLKVRLQVHGATAEHSISRILLSADFLVLQTSPCESKRPV